MLMVFVAYDNTPTYSPLTVGKVGNTNKAISMVL
jgi:hypothetical protein